MTRSPSRIDWRVVMLALPRRRFTAAELARAGLGTPDLTLRVAAVVNLLLPMAAVLAVFWKVMPLAFIASMAVCVAGVGLGMAWAWRDPSSARVRWLYYLMPLACGMTMGLMLQPGRLTPEARTAAVAGALVVASAALALWFAIVYRHQQIGSRLIELDERDRAVALARQLAAAQIQPHFLFNSLAALQHWVATQDTRAAPLLQSLTQFLRATLPLFDRPMLRVGDELRAVAEYLAVMQARLGERLAFVVDVPAPMVDVQLPPGVLLTLVENAVEHGVQASLQGARITVSGRVSADGRVVLAVADTGPGLVPGAADGVGLANTRARLAQAFGADATLVLQSPPEGGCVAELTFPSASASPGAADPETPAAPARR